MAVALTFVASCSATASERSWRVVADVQGRLEASPVVASDAAALAELPGGPPTADVDLAREVAIGIALTGAPGCEPRVVDVKAERSSAKVDVVIRLPKGPCGTIAVPYVVVVAVRRDVLPAAPFTVGTTFTRCAQGCVGPSVRVESLAPPG